MQSDATNDPTLTSSYHYDLPAELIAAYPPSERGGSRMLVIEATPIADSHDIDKSQSWKWTDQHFCDIDHYLRKGDLLVFNDAKVIPARIFAQKKTGGRVEVFVVELLSPTTWEESCQRIVFAAMTKSSNRLKINDNLTIIPPNTDITLPSWLRENPTLQVIDFKEGSEGKLTCFEWKTDTTITPLHFLEAIGHTPLPPYILKRRENIESEEENTNQTNELQHAWSEEDDQERYQNVFAQAPGAVAAPTAGLHFTHDILEKLKEKGVDTAYVTLEVGPGTFKPVSTDRITDHAMHSEYYTIPHGLKEKIEEVRRNGRRVIAVGTTSMRVIESEGRREEPFEPGRRSTRIFLSPLNPPSYCDGLLTNFHLPESTLLSLVAGFIGLETTKRCYEYAVEKRYRFYSYGDCMLILKQ